jgi:hypothetical protein
MEYRYFRHGDTNLDPTTRKPILVRVYGLYRVNDKEFTAEKYMGSNKWELDKSGDVVGSTLLGMEYWYEYDEITESEAEKLKQELFSEKASPVYK